MRTTTALVLVALLAGGCGAKRLVSMGDELARTGAWEGALEYYEQAAVRHPDDPVLQQKVSQARDAAVGQRVESSRSALDAGQYERAWHELSAAVDVDADDPRLASLGDDVADAWSAAVLADLAAGDLDRAYDQGVRLNKRFRSSRQASAALGQVRRAWRDEATARLQARDYPAAVGLLDRALGYDPGQADLQADRRVAVSHWVDALRTGASRAERSGRYGTALASQALAAQLSGDSRDAELRDQLRRRLLDERAVLVGTRLEGRRLDRLAQALALRVEAPAVRWAPGAAGARVGGVLHQPPADCHDEVAVHTGAHEFVAGMVQESNPDWERHRQALHDARESLRDAAENEAHLVQGLDEARTKVDRADRELARLHQELNEARRVAADTGAEVVRARERLEPAVAAAAEVAKLREERQRLQEAIRVAREALEALRDEARASGTRPDPDALSAAEAALAQAREDLEALGELPEALLDRASAAPELREAYEEALRQDGVAQALLRQAEEELEAGRARVQRAEARVREIEGSLDDVRQEQVRLRHMVDRAEEDLDRTPRYVDVPRVEVYNFEIQDVQRVCAVHASLDVSRPEEWTATASTSDRTWRGNPAVGLDADPLVFPRSDASLIAEADASLVGPIASALHHEVDGVRESLIHEAQAVRAEDQEAALAAWIVAWNLRPQGPPPAGLEELIREELGGVSLAGLVAP